MRASSALAAVALAVVTTASALILAEAAVRIIDGQPLTTAHLPPPALAPARSLARPDPTLGGGPLPDDVDPAWLDVSPPRPVRARVSRDIVAREQLAQKRGIAGSAPYRIWNRRFVDAKACKGNSVLKRLPQPILVFDPPEPQVHPFYRYPPSRTLPGGLVTNRFGWRGPDVPIDKPAGTVRIAFVGASTTFGLPIAGPAYPEYVVHWLNLWAQRANLSVRFDGVNAGREGIASAAIAAVIRQEVMPLEPDLVVYYEGANQSLCIQPLASPLSRPRRSAAWQLVDRAVTATRDHWQLARRLEEAALLLQMNHGLEPAKPALQLKWPTGLDEAHPDITRQDLGVESVILRDLETARVPLEAAGSELALTSFVWLVYDGLRLDPRRGLVIYRHLNERCWPYRYSDLRRSVDLHNHVLEQYAAAHNLPFIDIAPTFPRDPELFFDAIHLNRPGTRVQAWIVFRGLLPLVRDRLASGRWPRRDQMAQSEHPAATPGEPFTVSCPQS